MREVRLVSKQAAKESILAIGQELIRRADDITNDLEKVTSITIHAELNPAEIVNFDVTKNYIALLEESEEK